VDSNVIMIKLNKGNNILFKDLKNFEVGLQQHTLDKVMLHSSVYKSIFNGTYKSSGSNPRRRGVVKVSNGKQNVYLRFWGASQFGIGKDNFSVHPYVFNYLNSSESVCEFSFSKGSVLKYYWFNPIDAIRISFRLGSLSVILGGISIVLGII